MNVIAIRKTFEIDDFSIALSEMIKIRTTDGRPQTINCPKKGFVIANGIFPIIIWEVACGDEGIPMIIGAIPFSSISISEINVRRL